MNGASESASRVRQTRKNGVRGSLKQLERVREREKGLAKRKEESNVPGWSNMRETREDERGHSDSACVYICIGCF